jgi:hypothetical protein
MRVSALRRRHGGHLDSAASASGSGSGSDGYGNSDDNGYYGNQGSASGGGHEECCPIVVDPYTLAAVLGFLAFITYFLNKVITVQGFGGGRRKRSKAIEAQNEREQESAAFDTLNYFWAGRSQVIR